jgi:hypothetical protein
MNADIVNDPIFLVVFFVLGCKKLFSTSPNTIGSTILLFALACASSGLARIAAADWTPPDAPAPRVPSFAYPPSDLSQKECDENSEFCERSESYQRDVYDFLGRLYTSASDAGVFEMPGAMKHVARHLLNR